LTTRYDTPEMAEIWNERTRNHMERELWVAVMQAQARAGVPIPEDHIAQYVEAMQDIADNDSELEQIRFIEQQTGHDLYARLMYFNRMAGHEHAHLGLTSSDVTENVQQGQIYTAAQLLARHAEQVVIRLTALARAERARPMAARTHGQPAQITTVGMRVLTWANEVVIAVEAIQRAMEGAHPRGLVGAVGTRADLAALLHRYRPDPDPDGALSRAKVLDEGVKLLGVDGQPLEPMSVIGQCYPRSADLPIVSAALQLAAACNSMCTNVRLWATLGHANEARTETQVGSSAMPHKTNPRYSERVHSLTVVARGYASMLHELAGAMWFEGDVSTSAARRVALPGLFNTVDAILANTAHVLDRLEFYRGAIADDVRRYRPLLATGRLLEALVAAGLDRSAAHELIKGHVDTVMAIDAAHLLPSRLADDPSIPLTFGEVEELMNVSALAEPAQFIIDSALEGITDADLEVDEQWPGPIL
jgi:adenylosuccinate lyase